MIQPSSHLIAHNVHPIACPHKPAMGASYEVPIVSS